LLITGGEFVAFEGDNPVEIELLDTCKGNVRFVNCAFWGPADQNVRSHSKGFLSFSDCFFSSNQKVANPLPLIEADGGKLQIRGCSFWGDRPDILLNTGLEHAIISENTGTSGVRIINNVGEKAVIIHNEPPG
jgi:hypothetical protein